MKNIPEHARGRFPWDKPKPLLKDMLPRIEAMLAPLSTKRQRAYDLSRKTLKAVSP